jgi:hypothetical protein
VRRSRPSARRVGGVVALDPRTGAVTAAAGIGLSGLQPPGSTFKILTLVGGLEQGLTAPARRYPIETKTQLEGVDLENANGEACGGHASWSHFAESCNSVFAPLGAELGAEKARRRHEVVCRVQRRPLGAIDGAGDEHRSRRPARLRRRLSRSARSAIGLGRRSSQRAADAVVAAAIASAAAPGPHLRPAPRPPEREWRPTRASPRSSRGHSRGRQGGTGPRLRSTRRRGRKDTGTAELRSTVAPPQGEEGATPPPAADPTDTTAWFAAYAPVSKPRVAVGLLLTEAGAGGATAAPAARIVLAAALGRTAEPAVAGP